MPFKRFAAVTVGFAAMLAAQAAFSFGFEDVAEQAKTLSQRGYNAPQSNLSDPLSKLQYQDYAKISFKKDHAVWADQNLPFTLSFFHEGMHYNTPIKVNTINGEDVKAVKYSPDDFNFGDLKIDPEALKNLGFAGFKINYPINSERKEEVMVFLGASYFRVVGKGQRYGLSGRGLAIDTALSSGEEFPRFKEFWVVRPEPDDKYLTIYALLDSPSATGAYRYILRPGDDAVVDVQSQIYLRREVTKLGIAPLTSMFLYGPNQPSPSVNYRPAIHDSNGLAVNASEGDWVWRPLVNPKKLAVNSFQANNPRGFGLLQRSHNFRDYQDLDDRYDLRPSAWIEPQNGWGEGQVELVEIPTPNETNDNIVSFWRPTTSLQPGQPIDFNYRINWTTNEAKFHNPDLAWVTQTLRSRGEIKKTNLVREPDGTTSFVLDFVGPGLKALAPDANVTADISMGDNGELVSSNVERNPVFGGYRLELRMKPKDPAKPIDTRAFLKDGQGQRLSETWSNMLPSDA
nr:glucan biosynthesis protein G [Phytohalomonas tamaricis]